MTTPRHNSLLDRRLLKQDDRELADMLDDIERTDAGPAASRRRHPRLAFRIRSLPVALQHSDAEDENLFHVFSRNISAGGIAFIHGCYVHTGTRCTAHLRTIKGEVHEVTGVVVNCRYLEAGSHEVCVQFDQTIDPARYGADEADTQGNRRVLLSTHHDQPEARELLCRFVRALPGVCDALQKVVADNDQPRLTRLLASYRTSSRNYGFEPLAEQIELIEQRLQSGALLSEVHSHIDRLLDLSRLVRGPGYVRRAMTAPDSDASNDAAENATGEREVASESAESSALTSPAAAIDAAASARQAA